MKFNFIKHPGKVYPFFDELYVDYNNGFYLYSSGIHTVTSQELGKTGYVLSRQLYPIYKVSGDVNDTFSMYWGNFSTGGHVFTNNGSAFLYGMNLDLSFLLPFPYYKGVSRYTSTSTDIRDIKYGSPVIFKSTYKKDENDENDDEDSKQDANSESCVSVSLSYPCWYSKTLLGKYAPYWEASGNITIGTMEIGEDGESQLVEGNKYDLVYIGSLPVWN